MSRSAALRLTGIGLLAVLAAELVGRLLLGAGPTAPRARAVTYAAAMVAAGLVCSPGAARARSLAGWSLAVGLATAMLLALHAGALGAPVILRTAAAAAVLVLCLAAWERWLAERSGSREVGRLGLVLLTGCAATSPLWLGPLAELEGRGWGPTGAVAISPLSYLAAMAEWDYLRNQWFYAHTPLGSLRLDYPDPLWATLVYLGLAALLLGSGPRPSPAPSDAPTETGDRP